MRIHEMFNRVLIDSGHFLISKNNIELDVDSFASLVKWTLGVYSRYSPVIEKFKAAVDPQGCVQFTDAGRCGSMWRLAEFYLRTLLPCLLQC